MRGRDRRDAGGIAELARIIEEHGPALDYDLLTRTRYDLRDVGGALSWGALRHFVQYLPRDSALSRELMPPTDAERWTNGEATASLLADLFDLVAMLRSEVLAKGSGKKPKHPRPYPRPGTKPKNTRHVGSKPIPIAKFEEWWASRGERR